MVLVEVATVIEVVAGTVAIGQALGIHTSQRQRDLQQLEELVKQTEDELGDVMKDISNQCSAIRNQITAAMVIEVRSRLEPSRIPDEKLELLIKLLFLLKVQASNIVFAIVVKYPRRKKVGTVGVAGTTSERIEDLITRVDSFYKGLQEVQTEKTAFVNVRIRGKYNVRVETSCTALLYSIATAVCGLSRNAEFENRMTCPLKPEGEKTFVLLKPQAHNYMESEFDKLRRIYIIGDTRSGKSTVGNALLEADRFHVSKGLTGTMNIERGERVEEWNAELWRTDIFDTPGLNDGDNLDVWYMAAIEDHIQVMNQASTLIMTVSVSERIKGNTRSTLDSYRTLFGGSMASMLILILTVNEAATEDDLEDYKEDNRTKWVQFDDRLRDDNVFCVSLSDLRDKSSSDSHTVLEKVFERCRGMPLKLIQSLLDKRNELRQAMLEKRKDLEAQIEELVNNGWQMYEHLSQVYAASQYTKLTTSYDGMFDGLVMKKTSLPRKVMALCSFGVLNRIQKTAIEVQCLGKQASELWAEFAEENIPCRYDDNLMDDLGDRIYRNGLAVVVQDLGLHHILTLRVHRYSVTIFHPTSYAKRELIDLLQEVVDGTGRELKQEVIDELMKSVAIPARISRPLGRNWRTGKRNS